MSKRLLGVFIEGECDRWYVFSTWEYSIFGIPFWRCKEYITEYQSSCAESDYCREVLSSFTKAEAIEKAQSIKAAAGQIQPKKQVMEIY